MTAATIREKLHDYINSADDKKIRALYTMLDVEIEKTHNWWEDEDFVKELDKRCAALDSGEDKGYSWDDLKKNARNSLRQKATNV